jgi:alpha,alpha-trehalase
MSDRPWLGAPHVLREYALLADGERGALVGPHGDIVWMCFPHWDSDAVFSALVGGGGVYSITPEATHVWGGYYEPGSLIWRCRWITTESIVECRQALALPAEPRRATILSRVVAERGDTRLLVTLNPFAGFGRHGMRELARDDDGRWHALLENGTTVSFGGGAQARVVRAGAHRSLALALRLQQGEQHDFALTFSLDDERAPSPERCWRQTERAWRARVPDLAQTAAPRDATHAYAVMSGLSTADGGMVAAATTSLPERAEAGRNYDYRYVWIRDQCYAGGAAARAGAMPLLDDSVRFVGARLHEHGGDLRPAYTARGTPVPDERELGLPGYPGGGDRIGNRVNEQFQLDAFGEALLLLAAAAALDRLDADGWRAAEIAAAAILERWQLPDAGVWELAPARNWTHSRLICVAGLRAIAAEAAGRSHSARWVAAADEILAHTSRHALHPSGRWQRAADDPRLDAALLLAPLRGALGADDPRSLATLAAIGEELTVDGYCYRFRPDERPLGEAEGAFLLCGFWMALALAQQGDGLRAARWFERNRAACGPPGLLSEEFDVAQRQLRGNLPQAFAHALLLECAATLEVEP